MVFSYQAGDTEWKEEECPCHSSSPGWLVEPLKSGTGLTPCTPQHTHLPSIPHSAPCRQQPVSIPKALGEHLHLPILQIHELGLRGPWQLWAH